MRARVLDHVMSRGLVFVPPGAVAPVLARQFPALERCSFARLETFELLLRRDVHPELDQDRSILDELVLEVIDLSISAFPFFIARKAFNSFDKHAAVPTAIKDR